MHLLLMIAVFGATAVAFNAAMALYHEYEVLTHSIIALYFGVWLAVKGLSVRRFFPKTIDSFPPLLRKFGSAPLAAVLVMLAAGASAVLSVVFLISDHIVLCVVAGGVHVGSLLVLEVVWPAKERANT